MANPIKKDELVTEEALNQLNAMATTLTTIAENLTKAKAACQGWGEEEKKNVATTGDNVEELTKMSARISQLEDTIKKLTAAEKENNEQLKKTNEEKRKYKKLSEEEAAAVRSLAQGWDAYVELVKKGHTVTLRNKEDIDIQNKSYNELYQTYNALKDALNKLTTEQRTNTDVGKYMTAQALKIRDTMNELQQATGKYTLNVGNYQSAFGRLQFQAQQLMREAPSAISLQQFFLAISNNLPMFTDALSNFKAATKDMKARLKEVTEEMNALKKSMEGMEEGSEAFEDAKEKLGDLTEEQKNLKGQSMSTGKALVKSIVSWQTAILVGIMLLQEIRHEDSGNVCQHLQRHKGCNRRNEAICRNE